MDEVRAIGKEDFAKGTPALESDGAPAATAPPPPALTVKVLTMARPAALARLLESLAAAEYFGDRINLDVLVDGPRKGHASEAAGRREAIARADGFDWPHGRKRVIVRPANVGLVGQWMQALPARASPGLSCVG
jgi:hypothetical protein